MEEELFQQKLPLKRKYKDEIDINVHIDNGITSSTCYKILEDILKYLLYQRHQIPVQYEVLLKEVEADREEKILVNDQQFYEPNQDECSEGNDGKIHNEESEITLEDQYFVKIHHTKEDIIKQRRERKLKRVRVKIKEFIEDFKKVTQMLWSELETGDVTAVSFVLGSSVTSCGEIYTVILPSDFSTLQTSSYSDRNATMQFFRAFVTNDDLLNYMSRPCSLKKMWVMFERKNVKNPRSCSNWFSSTNSCKNSAVQDNGDCSIIPRPCFKPSYRSLVVQIIIHVPPLETPMDLTPIVGKGLFQHFCTPVKKMPSKRSLSLHSSNAKKHLLSDTNLSKQKNSQCICASPLPSRLDKASKVGTDDIKMSSRKSSKCDCQRRKSFLYSSHESQCLKRLEFSPRTPKINTRFPDGYQDMIIETPTVGSSSEETNMALINSPSRFLITKVDRFKLSDNESDTLKLFDETNVDYNREGRMWYLIDQCIKGFKNAGFKL